MAQKTAKKAKRTTETAPGIRDRVVELRKVKASELAANPANWRTHAYVDLYKIGRANYLPMTGETDWEDYTHRIVALVGRLKAKHYIKRDLQRYLPPGYHNPLRVAQHH